MPINKTKKRNKIKKNYNSTASIAVPLFTGLLGMLAGAILVVIYINQSNPNNIVWATDETVTVPKDLRKFLSERDECSTYKGAEGPRGVGLWGVYQSTNNQFAKIAYGCSWNLNSYIMAVKHEGRWELIKPVEYFDTFRGGIENSQGALPICTVIEKYKIPKDIEPFCINQDGSATDNKN